jgi:hypothetical protein
MIIEKRRLGSAVLALALLSGLSLPALAQSAADIDFGDDTSEWANDGECDDPRFTGAGMASELEEIDTARDATDCRAAFEAGEITLADIEPADTEPAEDAGEASADATEAPVAREIDFGDDTSQWANDGECDDPRFTGSAMAETLEDIDIARDATDCRTAFEAGEISLVEEDAASAEDDIDFGKDGGDWSNDQECDDPRFSGPGMAPEYRNEEPGQDATDCRNAFEDGTIWLGDGPSTPADTGSSTAWLNALASRIDFGDDSGDWPNDGECDDPDFVGSGAATDPYDANRMADASDCRAAFIAGTVTLRSLDGGAPGGFDYGNDSSRWSNDGECDDLRFTGPGMAKKLDHDDVAADATDCKALEAEGQVSIRPVYHPDYALGAPYDTSAVDFGDDSSPYANDSICDDPRFEGPGMAMTLLDSDRLTDATDCKAAFESGLITLVEGES